MELKDIRVGLARSIYDESRLTQVLQMIADYCKVPVAQFAAFHANGNFLRSAYNVDLSSPLLRDYSDRLNDNFRRRAMNEMPLHKVWRDEDVLAHLGIEPDEVADFRSRIAELAHYATTVTTQAGQFRAGFAIYKHSKDGPVGDDAVARLQEVSQECILILENVLNGIVHESKHALQIASPLGPAAAIDQRGHVTDHNDGFAELVKRGAIGLQRSWRPILGNETADAMLSRALDGDFGVGYLRSLAGVGKHHNDLICTIVPCVSRPLLGIDYGYMLIFFDEARRRRRLNTDLARAYYGFTDAEAEIAKLIFRGMSVAGISEKRGTAVSTTRSLLKRVLSKTGCERQAELVSMLGAFGEPGPVEAEHRS